MRNLRPGPMLTCSFVLLVSACAASSEPPVEVPLTAPVSAPAVVPLAVATVEPPSPLEPILALGHADPSCTARPICQGESCCVRLLVPGGTHQDRKTGDVVVAPFYLDKYELTVGRVRAWVDAGRPVPAEGAPLGRDSAGRTIRWGKGWQVMTDAKLRGWERYDTWRVGDADLPKNFIDWYTAEAVCAFSGGRLPSDAEWRHAAVGGEENRPYPWGSAPQTPERAVYNCSGDGKKSCSLQDVLAVGSRPSGAARWGHLDLAGSMFEWTMDAGGTGDTVARGGGFCYIGGVDRRSKEVETVDNVRRDLPNSTSHMVGARCAYDVEARTETASR